VEHAAIDETPPTTAAPIKIVEKRLRIAASPECSPVPSI
jgi:hypothetical protein